jgi:hypothetical protein
VDAGFRTYFDAALRLLAASPCRDARRTLRAIRRGHVRVQPFSQLSRADFQRVRDDLRRWNIHVPASRSVAVRTIARTLNGYMWSDRVYVHRDLSTRQLAATLVHEVNHVLNHSEAHYRGPLDVLREEYRAYLAEKRFEGIRMTRARCRALKLRVIREYQLRGLTPEDVGDRPAMRASRARR